MKTKLTAFDRFRRVAYQGVGPLFLERGNRLAVVSFLVSSWQWNVWEQDPAGNGWRLVAGRRDWNLGAHEACEEALAVLEAPRPDPSHDVTAAPSPPPVDPAAWTPDPDSGREFIVFDTLMNEYVAGIDPHDGDVSYASLDPRLARIFLGSEWLSFWTARQKDPARYRIDPAPTAEGGAR